MFNGAINYWGLNTNNNQTQQQQTTFKNEQTPFPKNQNTNFQIKSYQPFAEISNQDTNTYNFLQQEQPKPHQQIIQPQNKSLLNPPQNIPIYISNENYDTYIYIINDVITSFTNVLENTLNNKKLYYEIELIEYQTMNNISMIGIHCHTSTNQYIIDRNYFEDKIISSTMNIIKQPYTWYYRQNETKQQIKSQNNLDVYLLGKYYICFIMFPIKYF